MENIDLVLGYFVLAIIVFIILCIITGIGEQLSGYNNSRGDIITYILLSIIAGFVWPITALIAIGYLFINIGRNLAEKLTTK